MTPAFFFAFFFFLLPQLLVSGKWGSCWTDSGIFLAKICCGMLMPDASSAVFFPESGETALWSSSPPFALQDKGGHYWCECRKGQKDTRAGEQLQWLSGTVDVMWSKSRKIRFHIKNGFMKPASDKVSLVQVGWLSHKPGKDGYGNDLVQRRQALPGQPVVLSLDSILASLKALFVIWNVAEVSGGNRSIFPQIR